MAEDDRQTLGAAPSPNEAAVPTNVGSDAQTAAPVAVPPAISPAVPTAVPPNSADRWIVPAELVEMYGDALPPGGLLSGGFAAVVYRPPPPRIWTVFLAVGLSIPTGIAVSAVIGAVWLILLHGAEVFQDQAGIPKKLEAITMTPAGLVAMVIPGQSVFLAVALFAALLSPQSWWQRLRLVRGRLPLWTWLPLALATPSIAHLTALALSQLFDAPSEHLQQMEDLFRRFDARWTPVLFLLIAGLPGIAEELLFRGYVQSRLAQAWPPFFAIVLSGLMFGAAHLDPMHSVAVVPLGIWLGLISYRCDSLWPAIFGHVANNAFALIMMRFFHTETLQKERDLPLMALAMLLSSFLSLVVGIAIVVKKDRVAC
jgi:membrane protease YdiL (CAAX protease family)